MLANPADGPSLRWDQYPIAVLIFPGCDKFLLDFFTFVFQLMKTSIHKNKQIFSKIHIKKIQNTIQAFRAAVNKTTVENDKSATTELVNLDEPSAECKVKILFP